MTIKRTLCALLTAAMVLPMAAVGEIGASAAEAEAVESAAQVSEEASSGLADNIQDGVILHCFNWKYSDIKAELPNIAAAGFTSVQTSPAQPANSGEWYWLYQPKGFYISSNPLGTKSELEDLCKAADEYGIKVVVDVVANHFNGDHVGIQDDLRDSQYWHSEQGEIDYTNRWQIHQRKIGMIDINSEHSYVQQAVRKYVEELKNSGVDGIRWDAAKHIGLPSENCQFWPAVTENTGLWHYGEILDDPVASDEGRGIDNKTYAANLMKEYSKYISVTDSGYCGDVRMAFRSGSTTNSIGNWSERGTPKNKLVYWAESHDTFSNDNKDGNHDSSQFISQNNIDRTWAVVASQNLSSALYFSRPGSTSKTSIKSGVKGSTHYTSKEVAEVNKFHNAMIGKSDYYSNSNGCSVITRKGGGAVIVKGSGSGQVSVTNGGKYAKEGTYIDAVSGNTFTVTSSTISGTIGDSGIAVIYDAQPDGGVSADKADGTSFIDTITVKLTATDVTDAVYSTSEGASGSFENGQSLTLGASTAEGSDVTLSLSAKKSDGSLVTAKYTYKKSMPKKYPSLNGGGFVFDNEDKKWSTVNAYVYDDSVSPAKKNASWPGLPMTDCGNGYWKYELDSSFSGSNIRVIFNNGSEQTPAAQKPGYLMSSTDKKVYENGSWNDLPNVQLLSVSLNTSATSVTVNNPVTLTATAAGATGTVKYTFSCNSNSLQSSTNNTCTWTPDAAGTYKFTVTAEDSGSSASADITIQVTDDLANRSKVSATNLALGKTLTITGAASGGSGEYEYAYFYKRSTNTSWVTLGAKWTDSTTANLKPTGAATFDIKVVVRDKNNVNITKRSLFTVKCVGELKNKSTVSAVNLNVGSTLTITGAAEGGSGQYQYAYFYKRSTNSEWRTIGTQWTTSKTAKLTPTGAATFDIKVVVRDKNKPSDTKRLLFTVNAVNGPLTNTSTVNSTSLKAGSKIVLNGKASGGSGSYSYYYSYMRTTNSSWHTLGTAYGSATSASFTPTSAGTFKVRIIVKDTKSSETVTKTYTVTVN